MINYRIKIEHHPLLKLLIKKVTARILIRKFYTTGIKIRLNCIIIESDHKSELRVKRERFNFRSDASEIIRPFQNKKRVIYIN